jgi:hypothetical protein
MKKKMVFIVLEWDSDGLSSYILGVFAHQDAACDLRARDAEWRTVEEWEVQ